MAVENLKDDQLKALQSASGYADACTLIALIEQSGFEAYLVGGCVRDVLIGRELKDFDMCTSATPEDMKRIFKGFKLLLQGEAFGTVSVIVKDRSYEITTFRGDGVYSDSRHPDSVEFKKSLEEDLKRRDFTINALAFHPTKGLFDFTGGLFDIENKIIKTVGDPVKRFGEDALRVARLVRFAVQLGFAVDQKSLEAVKKSTEALKSIAKERIFTEFKKMVDHKPHFETMDQIFKASFVKIFNAGQKLNGFEKAFVALELSNILNVSSVDYILEKDLREKSKVLKNLLELEDIRRGFIKACDKFSLFGDEQLGLWKLLSEVRTDLQKTSVKPYSKEEVSSMTQDFRTKHQGKDLGEKIFNYKLTHFFA